MHMDFDYYYFLNLNNCNILNYHGTISTANIMFMHFLIANEDSLFKGFNIFIKLGNCCNIFLNIH